MELWLGKLTKAQLIELVLVLKRERNMYRDTLDLIAEEE